MYANNKHMTPPTTPTTTTTSSMDDLMRDHLRSILEESNGSFDSILFVQDNAKTPADDAFWMTLSHTEDHDAAEYRKKKSRWDALVPADDDTPAMAARRRRAQLSNVTTAGSNVSTSNGVSSSNGVGVGSRNGSRDHTNINSALQSSSEHSSNASYGQRRPSAAHRNMFFLQRQASDSRLLLPPQRMPSPVPPPQKKSIRNHLPSPPRRSYASKTPLTSDDIAWDGCNSSFAEDANSITTTPTSTQHFVSPSSSLLRTIAIDGMLTKSSTSNNNSKKPPIHVPTSNAIQGFFDIGLPLTSSTGTGTKD